MAKPRKEPVLDRLRSVCLKLPEASEGVTFGHPTFLAGKKTFCVLDHYQGRDCICFKAPHEIIPTLLEDASFFVAPYGGKHGWICADASAAIDWPQMEALLVGSYRLVALKRMLAALEGTTR